MLIRNVSVVDDLINKKKFFSIHNYVDGKYFGHAVQLVCTCKPWNYLTRQEKFGSIHPVVSPCLFFYIGLASFSVLFNIRHGYSPLHNSETIMGTVVPIDGVEGAEYAFLSNSDTLDKYFVTKIMFYKLESQFTKSLIYYRDDSS